MAALTITATSVIPGGDAVIEEGFFGAVTTAGQAVYKEAATGLFKLCDSDHATAEARVPYGIAVNGGAVGQRAMVQKGGDITIGGTLVAGRFYYASPTAGGICLEADVIATNRSVAIGFAKTTAILTMKIIDTAATIA